MDILKPNVRHPREAGIIQCVNVSKCANASSVRPLGALRACLCWWMSPLPCPHNPVPMSSGPAIECDCNLRAADEDVVDGNCVLVRRRFPWWPGISHTVDELDDVADDAHDQETDTDSLRDLDELALVGLGAAVDKL